MDVVTLGAEGTAMRCDQTNATRELRFASQGTALATNRCTVDGTATNKTARARC
jgi:hypothetical protein